MGMLSPDENGWVDGAELARLHKRYADLVVAAKMMLLDHDAGAPVAVEHAEWVRHALAALGMWPDAVDALDVLRTDGIDLPVVEFRWTAPTCECGRKTWELHHAPEGGLLVQCECGATHNVTFPRGGMRA